MASDRRRSSGSVSGMRSALQISATTPYSISTMKMPRHCVSSSTACPNDGATTGTAMNTIMASDTTLAMRRPE
jgi:hypothetical protein